MGYRDNANPALRELFFVVEDGCERHRDIDEFPPLDVWRQVFQSVQELDYPNEKSRLEDIDSATFAGCVILKDRHLFQEMYELADWAIQNLSPEKWFKRQDYLYYMRSLALFEMEQRERAVESFVSGMSQVRPYARRSSWYSMGLVLLFEYGPGIAAAYEEQEVAPWVLDFARRLWRLRYPKKPMPKVFRQDNPPPVIWEDLLTYRFGPRSTYRPSEPQPGNEEEIPMAYHLAFGRLCCLQPDQGAQLPELFFVAAVRRSLASEVEIETWPPSPENSRVLSKAHQRLSWLSGKRETFVEAGAFQLTPEQRSLILFCFVTGSRTPRDPAKVSLGEATAFLSHVLSSPEASLLLEPNGANVQAERSLKWRRHEAAQSIERQLTAWEAEFENIVGLFGFSVGRLENELFGSVLLAGQTNYMSQSGIRDVSLMYLHVASETYILEIHEAWH